MSIDRNVKTIYQILRFFIYIFIGILICPYILLAQQDSYEFYNFTEKEGLSDNIIYALHKDKNNIMWIGTQTGLSRFDGKNFYNFKQIHENGKYTSNTISCLTSDSKGKIWGGTHYGLFSFDPKNGKTKVFFPFKKGSLNFFSNIICGRNDEIYATGTGCILKYNKKTDVFEEWRYFKNADPKLNTYSVGKNQILLDEDNHCFWIKFPTGLAKLDYKSGQIITYNSNGAGSLFRKRSLSGFTKSINGEFWFFDYTNQKMVNFNPKTAVEIKTISLDAVKSGLLVSTTYADSEGKIWIGTWNHNFLIIDQKNNNKITEIHNKNKSNDIGSNFFWASFEDENKTMWFGTMNGLSALNTVSKFYKGVRINEFVPLFNSAKIFFIFENPDDKSWWITTTGSDIVQYYPSNHTYHHFRFSDFTPNPNNEKPGGVYPIYFRKDAIWLITDKGIWQKKLKSNKFVYLTSAPNELNEAHLRPAYRAPYWYFHNYEKIFVWNEFTNEKKWIIDSTLIKNRINNIFCRDKEEHITVLLENYLIVNYEGEKSATDSTIYYAQYNQTGYIADADMDSKERIWLSSKGVGLGMYDSKSKKFTLWSDKDGMADKDLHQITIDKKGNIWGLYWNKISLFNPKNNNFINIKIPFSENKIDYINYIMTRSDGVVMATVGNDIFELNSENLNKAPKKLKPSLNSIRFSDRIFFEAENVLQLKPDENDLRVNFGLMVDPASFPHTFEYKLEGADNEWIDQNITGEVNYNNLASGEYTLKLRAVNKNNNWKSDERILSFVIATPFYKKIWFIAFVLFSLLSAAYLYYASKIKARENFNLLQSKAQHLEKEKAQMMFDNLKQQLNPHFLFNSLTSLSALISTDQNLASDFLRQMSDMYRYILKNGDAESVTLEEELNFVNTYYKLQKTRFGSGLLMNIDVDIKYYPYLIAPVTLQNMMENAIKHNIIDRDDPLNIDIYNEDDYLIVRNNRQPKRNVETSNKKGLEQFKTLYKYLTQKPIIIQENDQHFIIKIPLIQNK